MTAKRLIGYETMLTRLRDRGHRLLLRWLYPLLCRWERVSGRRSRVALVAVWFQGRLLVVRHSYRPGTALPGGDSRRDETPLQTALRELAEEVGIEAEPDSLVPAELSGGPWTFFEYHPETALRVTIDNREIVAAAFHDPREIADPTQSLAHYLRHKRQRQAA